MNETIFDGKIDMIRTGLQMQEIVKKANEIVKACGEGSKELKDWYDGVYGVRYKMPRGMILSYSAEELDSHNFLRIDDICDTIDGEYFISIVVRNTYLDIDEELCCPLRYFHMTKEEITEDFHNRVLAMKDEIIADVAERKRIIAERTAHENRMEWERAKEVYLAGKDLYEVSE